MDYNETLVEMQRMREERKRTNIQLLVIDLRDPELAMEKAIERVQKFLDDHR